MVSIAINPHCPDYLGNLEDPKGCPLSYTTLPLTWRRTRWKIVATSRSYNWYTTVRKNSFWNIRTCFFFVFILKHSNLFLRKYNYVYYEQNYNYDQNIYDHEIMFLPRYTNRTLSQDSKSSQHPQMFSPHKHRLGTRLSDVP